MTSNKNFIIETLFQTLKLKRECGEAYFDLRGIGKTTLFCDNLTQLVQLPLIKNEKKLILILSNNIHINEIENFLIILRETCELKGLLFNTKSFNSNSIVFNIDRINFLFMRERNMSALRGIRPIVSKYYILNEDKDLINRKFQADIDLLQLTKIYFN